MAVTVEGINITITAATAMLSNNQSIDSTTARDLILAAIEAKRLIGELQELKNQLLNLEAQRDTLIELASRINTAGKLELETTLKSFEGSVMLVKPERWRAALTENRRLMSQLDNMGLAELVR